jgi:hypothetical protein
VYLHIPTVTREHSRNLEHILSVEVVIASTLRRVLKENPEDNEYQSTNPDVTWTQFLYRRL